MNTTALKAFKPSHASYCAFGKSVDVLTARLNYTLPPGFINLELNIIQVN
ncbi:hypothetical protein YA0089_28150 [Pseudomonas viridiflava]|nr:hypothetical protein [Pseudomonas viridiflava]MBI6727495.1 hypothetical protein [Pseudomonas viridiflava]